MSNIREIMEKYTGGEITAEEANEQLRLQKAGFHLEPGKNVITEEEKRATTIGYYPEQANGFGHLFSGTGTPDKVRVKDGRLVNCDMGESFAEVIIAGHTYQVKGAVLVEPEPKQKLPTIPERPDLRRRKDLAGQVVRQDTKAGLFDVTYDEDGIAEKATPVRFN